jgi:hypothetical protein
MRHGPSQKTHTHKFPSVFFSPSVDRFARFFYNALWFLVFLTSFLSPSRHAKGRQKQIANIFCEKRNKTTQNLDNLV